MKTAKGKKDQSCALHCILPLSDPIFLGVAPHGRIAAMDNGGVR
jgi:hypothetical protein